MKKNDPILIFGYSFPHRKTCDFLNILFALGFQNITVVAAPKLKLAHNSGLKNTEEINSNEYCVKNLCQILKINFEECRHDDIQKILKIKNDTRAQIVIISGARIIKREVIDMFPDGIVNFHPGKIPETSGLDSFYYSIKNNCSMGVTVHLIDHKVDAGRFIFFDKLKIQKNQSIDTVRENLYGVQLSAFKKYLLTYFGKKLIFKKIVRPKKNPPLELHEKSFLISKFQRWKISQLKEQALAEENFFLACQEGNVEKVRDLIFTDSYLISCHNSKGWSGIIIAAFWQHLDLVSVLIEMGANPNDFGRNGTTVVMYAKTKLLEQQIPNMSLLELLVEAGANVYQKDNFEKDIFDYLNVENSNERQVVDYLKSIHFSKKSSI